jgi:hypothetical protein
MAQIILKDRERELTEVVMPQLGRFCLEVSRFLQEQQDRTFSVHRRKHMETCGDGWGAHPFYLIKEGTSCHFPLGYIVGNFFYPGYTPDFPKIKGEVLRAYLSNYGSDAPVIVDLLTVDNPTLTELVQTKLADLESCDPRIKGKVELHV